MPVLLLWAVPTIIVVGGVGYDLVRADLVKQARPGNLGRAFFTGGGF